jgi:polar amino acid transport system substrate-binding protein
MNWKCITVGLMLAGAAALPAKADQLETILANKTLRCATYADVPPFSSPDLKTREMVGFDVDLCKAVARELGVAAEIKPIFAYTLSRAEQIQYSDPYYMAKEMLMVPADDQGKSKADYQGQRLASSKGSTSEMSIKLNKSEPLTFQDTGSAYLALQQGKARGMVANTMTITKLVNESQVRGKKMRMIEDPMLYQPIGIGMQKDQPALTAKVNDHLVLGVRPEPGVPDLVDLAGIVQLVQDL